MRAQIAKVVRVAERSLGLVTRRQLERSLTRSQIESLVRTAFIVRVHRGVYRLAGAAMTLRRRALAATLACGDGAVASHRTAAELWGVLEPSKGPVHVTIRNGRMAQHAGVVVHRTLSLPKTDVTLIPIPVTRVPRTISDLPAHLREEALDEAIRRRLITPFDAFGYDRSLDRLARDRVEHGAPEQKIERLAIAALRAAGLPQPRRQHPIRIDGQRYRLDLAYPAERIAIELEGRAPHWGRDRWQSDHDRRNALEIEGWKMLSYTWWDVRHDPDKLGRQASGLLARSPLRGARRGRTALR
jgi:very-short-patch-repair endonuclease